MSTIERHAEDGIDDIQALEKARRHLAEMSWEEDLGITVNALTDPDSPPLGFHEDRDLRRARPKRLVELALDVDLLQRLAESRDWPERVNEILRLAARMDSGPADDTRSLTG